MSDVTTTKNMSDPGPSAPCPRSFDLGVRRSWPVLARTAGVGLCNRWPAIVFRH